MAPLRVLVVDDDRDDAELTRMALHDAGLAPDVRTVSRRDALAPRFFPIGYLSPCLNSTNPSIRPVTATSAMP